MKHTNIKWRRITASLLALVMIITSLPVNLLAYANDPPPPDYGIGVSNNAYADNDTDYNNYQIKFYYEDSNTAVTTSPEFTVTDSGNETVYIGTDGKFELKKGRKIDFTSNEDFRNFVNTKVNDKRISKIEIEFVPTETTNDNAYELYNITSSQDTNPVDHAAIDVTNKKVTYNIVLEKQKLDENNQPVYEINPVTGDFVLDENNQKIPVMVESLVLANDTDYTVSEFTSSVLMDHDVIVNWHDTGAGRPEGNPQTGNLGIELERKSETETSYTPCSQYTPTITHTTSNIDTYEYKVPKYDANGYEYTYGANKGSSFSCTNTETSLDYRVEHEDNSNEFDLYGQRTFEFTLEWLGGAAVVPSDISSYITSNFNLYDEKVLDANNQPTKIEWTGKTITYDSTTGKVSISGFDQIMQDGSAKTYYMQKKDDNNIPVGVTNASSPYYGDIWNVTADNPGVHSSEIDKVYQNGTLKNVITGSMDFSVNVEWKDAEKIDERTSKTNNPADVVLWRYADTPGDNERQDKKAQAASSPVVQTENYRRYVGTDGKIYYYDDNKWKYDDNEGTSHEVDALPEGAKPVNVVPLDGSAGEAVTGSDNKLIYIDQVTFKDLPKYDRFGVPYVYTAKEQITGLSGYETIYKDNTGNIKDAANDGDTILNKLAGTRNFSVEAEWKAAARQGGEASVTYQLQYQDAQGNWHTVNTPKLNANGEMVDSNGNVVTDPAQAQQLSEITLNNFKAETMTKTAYFGPVPMYDNNGNKIVYRVVQTDVARNDGAKDEHGNLVYQHYNSEEVYQDTSSPIELDGDKYNIEVTPKPDNNTSDNYKFLYQLTGEIDLNIEKVWDDSKNPDTPTHDNDTIYATVERMDFGTNQFVTYTHDLDEEITKSTIDGKEYNYVPLTKDNKVQSTSSGTGEGNGSGDGNGSGSGGSTSTSDPSKIQTWKTKISVPIYDDEGHQYQYRVKENNPPQGYTVWITYDKTTNTYKISNTYTPPGGGPSLDFIKTWNDDGDLLHRNDVTINYTANVGRTNSSNSTVNGQYDSSTEIRTAGNKQIKESDSWRARIARLSNYTYNPNDFEEWETLESQYKTVSEIPNIPENTVNGKKWIYAILASYPGSQTTNVKNMAAENFVSFDHLVGIYCNDHHYYAVEQVAKGGTENNGVITNPSEIEFINTRIGVVSYEIDLNWCLGGWQSKAENANKKVKVKITPKIGGSAINGVTPIEVEIPVTCSKYFLTNLPKYNKEGKIIDWSIEEIQLGDVTIQNNRCTITDGNENKTCAVSATEPVYNYGQTKHTDDLIKVTLTNRFEGTTVASVNKVWYDDNNALGLRSDTYIRLYMRSTKTDNAQWVKYGNDYVFKADNDNSWHYDFTSLPKFDPEGYPYEYAIEELEMDDYTTGMYSEYNANTHTLSVLSGRMVPNGGTFTDRISGRVVIDGEKLWKDISPVLEKKHYPIAQINLQRQDKYKKNSNGVVETDAQGKKVLSTDADKIKIGQTEIYSGQSSFAFKPYSSWTEGNTTNHPHEVKDGYYVTTTVNNQTVPATENIGTQASLVLPKFDEDGALITYSLTEESINGYTFKISNEKIVNEYNGGRPIEITVTKNWENMKTDSIYPTIKLILHQVMFAKTTDTNGKILQNDGHYSATSTANDKLTPVEYATFEKTIRKDAIDSNSDHTVTVDSINGSWTYKFGQWSGNGRAEGHVKEDLRQFAPDGTCFAYYITEVLSNYEGGSGELNAVVNGDSSVFLGDFYKGTEIHNAITSDTSSNLYTKYNSNFKVLDNKYGFTVTELTQPAEITNTGTDALTTNPDNSNNPITRTASITNTYEPDKENFKGKLVVNKTWNDHKNTENGENGLNREFETAHDYTFDVSRRTPKLGTDTIFRISTWDITENKPKVEIKATNTDYDISYTPENDLKAYDSSNTVVTGSEDIAYYLATINYGKTAYLDVVNSHLTVTIKINKTPGNDYNKVEIDGLAIYGQDAVKYKYSVTEISTVSTQTNTTANPADNGKNEAYKLGSCDSCEMTETTVNNEQVIKADFTLGNDLKVFKLNLYKVFGKTFKKQSDGSNTTAILSPDDYPQYFNDEFVNNLRFMLERKKGENGTYDFYDYNGSSVSNHIHEGTSVHGTENHKEYSLIKGTDNGKTIYYLTFDNLPKYSPDGYVYYYRVTELNTITETDKHFETTYPENSGDIGRAESQGAHDITCGENDNAKNTYVRNNFESKQITVNKYWNDTNNADGLRPENLKVTIKEYIQDNTPASVDINKVLRNSVNSNDSWTMKVELPKYYYNGITPKNGLTFGIKEFPTDEGVSGVSAYNLTKNGYSLEEYGYETGTAGSLTKQKYTTNISTYDTDTQKFNIETANFYSLYLQNKQDKRVNSKLTFDKTWDDMNNKWSLRPDNIYIKVLRKSKAPIVPDSSAVFTVSGQQANANQLAITINSMPSSGAGSEYKLVKEVIKTTTDPNTGEETQTSEWVDAGTLIETVSVENNQNVKKLTTLLHIDSTDTTLRLKLQRKKSAESSEYEDVTKDAFEQKYQVFAGTSSESNTVVTKDNANHALIAKDIGTYITIQSNSVIPVSEQYLTDGKVNIWIEGLDEKDNEGHEYTYQVLKSSTNNFQPPETISPEKRSSAVGKVNLLLENLQDSTQFFLKVQRSVDNNNYSDVTISQNTVFRYFTADSTTGVVALPTASTENTDNPKVVFENLDLGVNTSGDTQSNGTWNPYYYTTVECDKYGKDVNSVLTYSQRGDDNTNAQTAAKISFDIDVRSYSDRKHLNIQIKRGEETVKTDIYGNPLKITITGLNVEGNEFYASSVEGATPAAGVFVIPISSDSNTISCEIDNLPYAPVGQNGDWSKNGDVVNQYTYTVERCTAKGTGHDVQTGFPANGAVTAEQSKLLPKTTTVTFKKTMSSDASVNCLSQENIHLKLFRKYDGGSEEEVTVSPTQIDDGTDNNLTLSNIPANNEHTISNLKAGTVIDEDGAGAGTVGIWKEYTYYFKEYYDSELTNLKSENNAYDDFVQTKGIEKPFVLQSDNKTATLEEGIRNDMKTTKHDVIKKWLDDNGVYESRDDYSIVLQRRAGDQGAWEYVDIRNTDILSVDQEAGEIPSVPESTSKVITGIEDFTVTENGKTYTYKKLKVAKDKLHIRFDKLPICDSKGVLYQYRVAEIEVGNQNVVQTRTFLFLVPGTEPTDDDYSYVRIIRRGSRNYYVSYNYDNDYNKTTGINSKDGEHVENKDYDHSQFETAPTRITNQIITNSIEHSQIKVVKTWADEDNVYGRRPQKITYRLTRTKDGSVDQTFTSDMTVGEADNWEYSWSQLAAFAADGGRFEYSVAELPIADYQTYAPTVTTKKDNNGEMVKQYSYTNTYTPVKKTITAKKNWADWDNKYGLRPAEITYELYCKYDIYTSTTEGYNGPVYDTKGTESTNDDVQSEVYKEILKANKSTVPSNFKNTLTDTNPSSNNWETSFSNLPAWINPTGDGQYNGKAVEVTYYIVESFGTGDANYKKVYNCEASNKYGSEENNIPGTSNDTYVLEKGLLYTDLYTPTNDIYTVPKSIAVDKKLNVMLKNMDVGDNKGNKYTYAITETDDSGNVNTNTHKLAIIESPFIGSDGKIDSIVKKDKTDLLISAKLGAEETTDGNIYFKITQSRTVTDNSFVKELTGTAGNVSYTVNSNNVICCTPGSNGDFTIKFTLPKGTGETNFGYTVQECASENGTAAETNSLTITADVNSTDNTKADVTVTKTSATAETKLYFKLSKDSTVVTSAELTGNTGFTFSKMIFSYKTSGAGDETVNNQQITISGLPEKDAQNNTYKYEAVEYDNDTDEAVELSPPDNNVMTTSKSTSGNGMVSVTVTKLTSKGNKTLYFKLRRSTTSTPVEYITNAVNKFEIRPIDYTEQGNPTVLKSVQDNGSSITNTLNTRDIIVTKVWNDNGYTDGRKLHYDIDVTLSSTQFGCTEQGRYDTSTNNYKEVKTIPKDYDPSNPNKSASDFQNAVIFRDLPRYDSSGTEITYSVAETLAAVSGNTLTNLNDNYLLKENINSSETVNNLYKESLTWTFPTDPVKPKNENVTLKTAKTSFNLINNQRKYGYEGYWESYKPTPAEGEAEDPCVERFKIINELPVVKFDAKLYWNDDSNRDGKRLTEDDVVLSRDEWDYAVPSEITLPTDRDYVYFVVPTSGASWTETNADLSKIRMYLSKSGESGDPVEVEPVSVYTKDGKNYYRFPAVPDGYDTVYFKTVLGETAKQTVNVTLTENDRKNKVFTPGTLSGGTYACTSDVYNNVSVSTQSFSSRGKAIEIDLTDDSINGETWDDPQIIFYDNSNAVIGAKYVLEPGDETGKYVICVPEGAVKFSIDNGKSTPHVGVTSTDLTPGQKYKLKKENNNYSFNSSEKSKSARAALVKNVDVKTLTKENKKDDAYWYAYFGVQPVFSEDGTAYTYRISEKDDSKDNSTDEKTQTTKKLEKVDYTYDYSPSVTMTNGAGTPDIHKSGTTTPENWQVENERLNDLQVVTTYAAAKAAVPASGDAPAQDAVPATVTFAVRNNYSPSTPGGVTPPDPGQGSTPKYETGKIKLTKSWVGDDECKDYSRPSSMTFILYCKYTSNNDPNDPNSYNGIVSSCPDVAIKSLTDKYTVQSSAGWQLDIDNLPKYTNPTGTPVDPGEKLSVTYYLVETEHPGYTQTGDNTDLDISSGEASTTVTNTLKTTQINVKKKWEDHGYSSTHFTVNVTVTLDETVYTKTGTVPDGGTLQVRGLPLYKADKTKATYTVSEDENNTNTSTKFDYNYSPSYDKNGIEGGGTIEITNELPVRTLNVTKTWNDTFNGTGDYYKLRPETLALDLKHSVSESGTWTDVDMTKATLSAYTKNGTIWTATYSNLLEYDKDGNPYLFKVTETVPNAYTATNESIVTVKTENTVESGVSLENNLITGTLTVIKNWDDQSVTDVSHYDVTVKAESTGNVTSNSGKITFAGNNISSSSGSGQSVTINNVPVFDMNGNKIEYLITETNAQKYGYYLTTAEATRKTELTETSSGVYTGTVTLTNKLPKTDITVTKIWNDFDDKYGLRPSSVNFNLYRTTTNADVSTDTEWTEVVTNQAITSANSWKYTFSNLLKYDESGNEYRYKVKEVYENGVKAYTELDPWATTEQNSGNADSTYSNTFTNELKKRNITVTKVWDDKKYGNSLRYNLDMTLSCGDLTCTENNRRDTNNKYQETKQVGTANTSTVTYQDLPYCNANGTPFVYKLEENVHGQQPVGVSTGTFAQTTKQSGYEATCVETKDSNDYVTGFTVTNTLPLTSVPITKTWTDNSDSNHLRPSSITLTLWRTTTSNLTRGASSGWEQVGSAYELTGPSDTATWSHTFTNLLKYDVSNNPYYFKVEEEAVNAYTTTYGQDTAVSPETGLGVTNKLITRSIQVNKEWDDSDYTNGESLHYNITFKLTKEADTGADPGVPQKLEYTGTINKVGSSVTISDVPVYDKNGSVITYTATESGQQYGYYLVSGYPQKTVANNPSEGINDNCVMTYTFRNKLPVTYLKVTKAYPDNTVNETYHKYTGTYTENNETHDYRDIKFDVTRTVNNSDYENVFIDQSIPYVADAESRVWTTDSPVLVKNVDNKIYTYKVEEQTLKGYTASYKVGGTDGQTVEAAETAASAAPQTIDITNTRITGDVKMQKIDYTYYERHFGETNYSDKAISGAKFRLYIKNGADEVQVPVSIAKDNNNQELGYYVFDTENTASDKNIVESKTVKDDQNKDVYGIIDIRGLPLNTYYLKETEAVSAAFKKNEAEFSFTVDVDDSNVVSQTFTDGGNKSNDNGTNNIFDSDGFITHENKLPKIGNEETPRSLTFTKVDATDKRALPNATYYLLYMIPYQIGANGQTEEQYKNAAKQAVQQSGGKFTDDVKKYWRIEKIFQTDSNGKFSTIINENGQNGGEGLMHGVYTFMEVQAPVGYDINNTEFDSVKYEMSDGNTETHDSTNNNKVLLIDLDETHVKCYVTQTDPRKDAKVKIYKQDEFNNPLDGAEFELYYDPPKHNSQNLSDFDFIFFTDNDDYNNHHFDNDNVWGDAYAQFYDNDNEVGEIQHLTTYWINDDGNDRVYKVKIPDGASQVVFSNGDKKTNKITFTPGYGYYKTNRNGNEYTVNSDDWNHAGRFGSVIYYKAQTQETYGDHIYIENTDLIGNNTNQGDKTHWDDLHVCFYDNNDVIVGQQPIGYCVSEPETINNQSWFVFDIPIGAKKFTVNNGNRRTNGDYDKKIDTKTAITPNAGYQITENNGTYSISAAATIESGTVTTPAPGTAEFTEPIKIATVTTGYDGLPSSVTNVNTTYASVDTEAGGTSVKVKNWGSYYFVETSNPTGYTSSNGNINFTIGAEQADEVVHIEKADNARKAGSVILTKTAQEKVGNIKIGAPVEGATFELYKNDAAPVKISVDNGTNSVYTVNRSGSGSGTLTTNRDGQFTITDLDWGQYYLQEVEPAPTGFALNTNKIYFTVGRNNCGDIPQQLTTKDPAAKAKIKITKTIDERIEAWGYPTFIFKLKNKTDNRVRIISLTMDGNADNTGKYFKATDYIEVEPGTYEVTEVKVARYEFNSTGSNLSNYDEKVTNTSFDSNGVATFTIAADGAVTVNYNNKVAYYDKFSHVDCKVNNFHGYKGIRVEYTTPITADANDKATISKSDLDVYKILSSGKEIKMTADEKNALTLSYTYVSTTGDDANLRDDFVNGNGTFTISNVSRYTDGVYKLKAKDTNNFECTFDINFASKNNDTDTYQKKVVFKADSENKSYFEETINDTKIRTVQYELTFTMVKDGSTYKVFNVKHNGNVISNPGNGILNTLGFTVNEAYAYDATNNTTGLELDKWNDGSSDFNTTSFDTWLKTKPTLPDKSETKTYTAKLKQRTNP